MQSLQKEFKAEVASTPRLLDLVEEFMAAIGFPDETTDVQVAAEEHFVNIVKHGFEGMEPGTIIVRLDLVGSTIMVTMADDGREFDPHTMPIPDDPASVEEATIGGQGIRIIMELMDETEYHRGDGMNRFTMRKRLNTGPNQAGKDTP